MWEKGKPLAFFKPLPTAPISQCTFHPNDNSVFCISGTGVMKVYRYLDNTLKLSPQSAATSLASLKRDQQQKLLCHAWVAEERIVVGSDAGELILFEGTGEFKTVLPQSPTDGLPINAMVAYSKGFICGGGAGSIMIYEKTDDKDYYKKTKTISINQGMSNLVVQSGGIHSLAISPAEENIIVTTENNQIFTVKLFYQIEDPAAEQSALTNVNAEQPTSSQPVARIESKPDIKAAEKKRDAIIVTNNRLEFEYLTSSFHSNQITGLDSCIRKPYIVTSSIDKTIRLWYS
jgi:WD40 repeat protein